MKQQSVKLALSVVILAAGMLVLATPAYAQEGSAATTNQPPAGIGILILLMGLAAIGFIGFAYLAQSRANREGDAEAEEE